MSVLVYGASDDLVELDGDVYEEFNCVSGKAKLAFSNGVLLKLKYDGVWRITVLAGESLVAHFPSRGEDAGNDEEGVPGYSEKAYVTGPIEWVALVKDTAFPRGA